MSYLQFKERVLNERIGDGECVSLVVNNSQAYIEYLFPGINWTSIIPPVNAAKDMAGKGNHYLQWIPNNHNDPNQVPAQGDIMVFGATPAAGYMNTYPNPDGHTGICDSASSAGYDLLQQNAPEFHEAVNVTRYSWKFRPCLGWYHPLLVAPHPAPAPAPKKQSVFLPSTAGPWHLYNIGSSYNPNDSHAVRAVLRPDLFKPGLTYQVQSWIGDYAVVIQTQDFGRGVIWVKGTPAVIK